MAYRHCHKCGWGYAREEWREAVFCTNCGAPLRPKPRARARPPRVEHITPYPEVDPGRTPQRKPVLVIDELLDQLSECAEKHPFWFSAGALAAGAGALMLGPGLVTLGQGVMMIGGILVAAGMLSVVYAEKEDATKLISAGLLTLVAGTGVALVGYVLTAAGIVAVVAGSGVLTKATVQHVLRKRIEKQLRKKSIDELWKFARQLEN